jgi:hypothetical protein
LELRKAGGSYRQIAKQLGVDAATVHADVRAELGALRERTVEQAQELRDLELHRCDQMPGSYQRQTMPMPSLHLDYVLAAESRGGGPLTMGDALAELLADITEAARTIGTLLPQVENGRPPR